MSERRLIQLGGGEKDEATDAFVESFAKKEFLTQEDISQFTGSLLAGFLKKIKEEGLDEQTTTLLVDALSDEKMFVVLRDYMESGVDFIALHDRGYYEKLSEQDKLEVDKYLGMTNTERKQKGYGKIDLSIADMRPTMVRIRKNIMYELSSHLEPEQFLVVKSKLLETKPHLKRASQYARPERVVRRDRFKTSESNQKAFARLKAFQIQTPEIVKPLSESDTQITMPKVDNLRDMSLEIRAEKDPKVIMQYWVDMMDLLARMEKAGVTMRDIKPENIEIDQTTHTIKILDIETIFAIGSSEAPLHTEGYKPPEWRSFAMTIPVSDKEASYQMGIMLSEIQEHYQPALDTPELNNLIDMLVRVNPDERLSVQEALELAKNAAQSISGSMVRSDFESPEAAGIEPTVRHISGQREADVAHTEILETKQYDEIETAKTVEFGGPNKLGQSEENDEENNERKAA